MAAEKTQQACLNLTSLNLSNVTIRAAEVVEAGKFNPPSPKPNASRRDRYRGLPAFCRLKISLTPSDDSDINMELWLPVAGWNGKYLAVGNGAFTGNVRHSAMIYPLGRGYATSSTDTGHSGNTASFGIDHPEKVSDFGWRAVHEMAKTSKQIVAAYYQRGPQYSYWTGCSAGGRQGMKEAQRFPNDFDGIVAGAPGLDWTGRAAGALRVARHLEADESARLSSDQRELVYQAAINACDSADGLKDGLISQPEQCRFDPAILQCDSGDGSASCLSKAQVNTVRMLYASPVNPASGRAITGLLPGSEPGWTDLGWTASARASALDQFRYLVHADPDWKVDRFDFERDIVKAEQTDNDSLNALNPNLQPFFDRGGKLIQYHGWVDPQISPSNTTQYYQRVTDELGGRSAIHDSYRLFMAPGMAHCARGPGPNSFDSLSALEAWVEQGIAPDSIIAVHRTDGEVDRSRPLCPFPEVAAYDGTGSIDEAENFECRIP
ncbi:MAG: tannase/feruloyl esterase family alpha/beta hydrolase [Gammaproteobacteria bacterium]|nr:tannase/feruloyl esterase family alpha/beta hydrolase [Gammaproteobacteria bacterium]